MANEIFHVYGTAFLKPLLPIVILGLHCLWAYDSNAAVGVDELVDEGPQPC